MYAVDVQDFLISQLSDQGLKPRAESNFIIRCDSPTTGVHKRQPLQVDLEKQVWIDHSTGKGGNFIQLVMLLHRIDYWQALKLFSSASVPVGSIRTQPKTRRHRSPPTQLQRDEFRYREIVIDGIYNRTDPSRIKEHPDVPDYDGNPTAFDNFHSGYLHTSDLKKYAIEHGGSVAGYRGPVWVDWLTFDIDSGDDLEKAREIGLKVYDKLLTNRIERHNIRIYFSGNKGFHLSFKSPILDKISGYESTPKTVKEIVHAFTPTIVGLAGNVYTDKNGQPHSFIDPAIYSCTSLLRSPNSRHNRSNLYKVPLSESEFQFRTIDQIKSMAIVQRNLYL